MSAVMFQFTDVATGPMGQYHRSERTHRNLGRCLLDALEHVEWIAKTFTGSVVKEHDEGHGQWHWTVSFPDGRRHEITVGRYTR